MGVSQEQLSEELCNMLAKATHLYGKRNHCYTIDKKIYFRKSGPGIYFPEGINAKRIQIELSENSQECIDQPYYQLAHETIHLLSPVLKEKGTRLEEGIAVYFSLLYLRLMDLCNYADKCIEHFKNKIHTDEKIKLYYTSYTIVKPHLEINKYGIKNIRQEEFVISNITSKQLIKEFPDLTRCEIQYLISQAWPKTN